MSNLLASLITSAGSLAAYTRVLDTAQNNVANISTPGYAKESMSLTAMPFDPAGGATGGVRAGQLESSRNEYAEAAVRQQSSAAGYQQQAVSSLTDIESRFDISGNSGIPQALNNIFQSFSAWASTPDNQASRQMVLDRAGQVAGAFQQTYNALSGDAANAEQQIRQTVDQVNQKVAQIANYNHIALQGNKDDSGLSAQIHSSLEDLSQLVDFSARFESDGSVTISLNGSTPLLIGDRQFAISTDLTLPQNPPPVNSSAPASARVLGPDGTDITGQTTGGQLGALLEVRNHVLASYLGDGTQAGDLNVMAKQFATRVNSLLSSGQVSPDPPPQSGVPLFTFDTTNDTAVARTLAVDPTVTSDQLAAVDPGPPMISNGVALALAQLASPTAAADKVDNVSYSEFYGQLAARTGAKLNDATTGLQVQQSLLAQSKELRQQYSGVSLDEEATILIQFQRAYQANSRFISVLDQLTQTTIDILK